jgi:hypothetical protein
MPLRDHFHDPLREEIDWESFHSAWANTMVRHLNERLLPARYRSQPELRLSNQVEIDVATLPLWLAGNLGVPLDLEASYEETCRVLRIA